MINFNDSYVVKIPQWSLTLNFLYYFGADKKPILLGRWEMKYYLRFPYFYAKFLFSSKSFVGCLSDEVEKPQFLDFIDLFMVLWVFFVRFFIE